MHSLNFHPCTSRPTLFYRLCTPCCALLDGKCTPCCALVYTPWQAVHSLLCTPRCALLDGICAPCWHSLLCTPCCALLVVHSCTLHNRMCTLCWALLARCALVCTPWQTGHSLTGCARCRASRNVLFVLAVIFMYTIHTAFLSSLLLWIFGFIYGYQYCHYLVPV